MPEDAEILDAVEKLPTMDVLGSGKPHEEDIWQGDEGDVHFKGVKRNHSSHGGMTSFCLYIEGKSPEGRERFISKFVTTLGEPLIRKGDPQYPDDEYLEWPDIDNVIEQKERDKKQFS